MPVSPRTRRCALATAVLTLAALAPTAPSLAAAPAADLGGAHWIWYPEGNPAVAAPVAQRYLRRTFSVPAGTVSAARLVLSGDDTVDVWVNGRYLAGSRRVADSWHQAVYVDLAGALRTGANTVAVAARNNGGPAGVVGRLTVATTAGTVDLVTDGAWRAAQAVPENWAEPDLNDGGWAAAADLGAYGVAPWNANVSAPDLTAAAPVRASALTTERRTDPVGIDVPKPMFGWRLTSDVPGQVQGAYQVTVGTTADATGVWDSGRVVSDRSVDVPYGGPAPAANRTYHWRVRVWDAQGRAGDWSPVARFDTALSEPGAFIGRPSAVSLSGAAWMWYPEGDPDSGAPVATRYFRHGFTVQGGQRATLLVTGDDIADVWVNGVAVSGSPRSADAWKQASTVDITDRVRAGANTIAIAGTNTSAGPAGVLARVVVNGSVAVTSDGSWKAAQSAPAGWEQPGYDDAGWPAARAQTTYGGGPWGDQVGWSSEAPYLRRGFTVGKPVVRARLMATALGLHETYLNGSRVGNESLAPGWTDYRERLQYRTHDVTALIRQGTNAIGALIGNGWYSGNIGFAGNRRYGTDPWYSARLVVEHPDGTSTTVATDGSWRTAPSDILANDLYGGEQVSARYAAPGWNTPTFDDSSWGAVTVRSGTPPHLVAQVDPGVRVQREFRPVSITQPRPGVYVADLGQNFAGWNRLRVRGPAGTTVTLRHAEILNADGTVYTTNLRAARATDTFTLAGTGGDEVFEPRFTVHGYRYVEITGFPGTPTADSLTGLAAWTDGAGTGTFASGNPLLNQVHHNIAWGARSNLLSVPTDCPQRDERLGWTGDIAAFAGTSTFSFDVHGLLAKFNDDLRDAQRDSGAFTDVAPFVMNGDGKAGWGDAGVIVPYTLWQRYGDLRVVEESYPAMARWVEYLRTSARADLIRQQDTFGDWVNVQDETDKTLISTAYFAWSARLVSRMAAATGRTGDAARYGTLADQVAAAFTSAYVAADGTVAGNTQTGYVLALSFELVPSARRQAVADRLVAKVNERGGHLSVGFLGVENLLPVLAEYGHVDTAYRILLQPDYPGWGYQIARGATTIWERWDSIRPDGSLQDPGMNSFNHYAFGAVGDWMYRTVGGLAPAAPGYQRVLVAPRPGDGVPSAVSDLVTPYGRTRSDWRKEGSRFTLQVVIPPNATATVRVPAGTVAAPPEAVPVSGGAYLLPSGSYTFTVN
jgi:alpha-L-rhamnosidase